MLAELSELSERFLAQLEAGSGNISLLRFARVAEALEVTPASLLTPEEPPGESIALLGVRGAGKSTIGAAIAASLGRSFVEIDQRIEEAASLSLAEIFELHGEAYYRRIEREVLARILANKTPQVLATGGSIVNHAENWSVLASQTTTVWLKAQPEDHWERVIRQGDKRPMAENPHAFAELRALLVARAPLYDRADITIETSSLSAKAVAMNLLNALESRGKE